MPRAALCYRAVRRIPLIILGLATALGRGPAVAGATASAWSDHRVVAVRLIAATPAGADRATGRARPGGEAEELRLGLHFRLAPKWHVYWKHPGDAGAPPQVAVSAQGKGEATAHASRLLFPAPHRFRLPGGLEALGYEGEVVYPLRLVGALEEPAARRLTASVDYVACAVECIPYHDELELPSAESPLPAEDALLARWEAKVPRPLETLPGLLVRLLYEAGTAPELVLELSGPPLRGAAPELFLEPAPGATFGSPTLAMDGARARFRSRVEPEVAGALPRRLAVTWTVTGLSAGVRTGVLTGMHTPPGTTVTARTEVEVGAEELAGAPARALRAARAGRPQEARALLRSLLAGVLLALNPTGLALLLLLTTRPLDPRRRSLPPLLAALALAASLAGVQAGARASGVTAPLSEPVTVAALALVALAFSLLLWVAPAAVQRLPPETGATLAPLLAAPSALIWLPLAGWSTPPAAPSASAMMAVGFALPFLAAGLLAGRLPALSLRLVVALGFVAAVTPVAAAYRLALLLPAHRLAGIELSWLGVALAVRAASTARALPRRAWCLAAIAAGGASLWLA